MKAMRADSCALLLVTDLCIVVVTGDRRGETCHSYAAAFATNALVLDLVLRFFQEIFFFTIRQLKRKVET